MFRYYDSKREVPLCDPYVMRDFCEKNSPGLFDLLLKAITRNENRLSSERQSLERQRAFSLLHILSYFRFDPNTFALRHDNFLVKDNECECCRMIYYIFNYGHIGEKTLRENVYYDRAKLKIRGT